MPDTDIHSREIPAEVHELIRAVAAWRQDFLGTIATTMDWVNPYLREVVLAYDALPEEFRPIPVVRWETVQAITAQERARMLNRIEAGRAEL